MSDSPAALSAQNSAPRFDLGAPARRSFDKLKGDLNEMADAKELWALADLDDSAIEARRQSLRRRSDLWSAAGLAFVCSFLPLATLASVDFGSSVWPGALLLFAPAGLAISKKSANAQRALNLLFPLFKAEERLIERAGALSRSSREARAWAQGALDSGREPRVFDLLIMERVSEPARTRLAALQTRRRLGARAKTIARADLTLKASPPA